jgi:uncharacterized protein (TIRG00374 family)
MHPRVKTILTFVLRWGIAVAGIYYVLSNINLRDTTLVLDANQRPVLVRIQTPAVAQPPSVVVTAPPAQAGNVYHWDQLVSEPDDKTLRLTSGAAVQFLGVQLSDDPRSDKAPGELPKARKLLVADNASAPGRWIDADQVVPPYVPHIPHPRIVPGITSMVAKANPWLLLGALAVFPITIAITSWRFDLLLRLLEIHMSLGRAFVINMVGAFYNTFMPGSTGGDVFKAYYASKLTTHRTRAVVCVLVDRILGLLALVILGGSTALCQWSIPACRKVALGSAAICVATTLGLLVFYQPTLRRLSGLDFLLRRLPMQSLVKPAVEAMDIYGRHPWQILMAVLVTLPVHGAVVISATLAGFAFGLPLHWFFYWAAIPVIVLSGSIPISPQGAGVMEFFAILLTRRQGVTIAQVFALTMSIRMVQIFWNLTGGIFVLRGGFHAPTTAERESMETDLPDMPGDSGPGGAVSNGSAPAPAATPIRTTGARTGAAD